jgi:hypothetical protein
MACSSVAVAHDKSIAIGLGYCLHGADSYLRPAPAPAPAPANGSISGSRPTLSGSLYMRSDDKIGNRSLLHRSARFDSSAPIIQID